MFSPVFLKLDGEYIWINESPNSSNSCRPISILIDKENMQLTKNIHRETLEKVSSISHQTAIEFLELPIKCAVNILPKFVMIDGQAANHIFNNKDTQKCFVCLKRGKELHQAPDCFTPVDESRLEIGLKPLHSSIRIFEKLLSIRYKKGIFRETKKNVPANVFQWMKEQNKAIIRTNKYEVHKQFWNSLKIDVDRPKQGFGSTTDGNCAKTAFKNFSVTASILDLSEELIHSIHMLICLLYSTTPINPSEYQYICQDIYQMWLEELKDESITPSLHLILAHGLEIIEKQDMRPGLFTEEGLESTHKEIRKIRLRFARKSSREENMLDIIKRLFINSSIFV